MYGNMPICILPVARTLRNLPLWLAACLLSGMHNAVSTVLFPNVLLFLVYFSKEKDSIPNSME